MKGVILLFIRGYKKFISPYIYPCCRFEPTCSVYMYQAVAKFGVVKGIYYGIRRLLRCHPFHKGGYDPVPEK